MDGGESGAAGADRERAGVFLDPFSGRCGEHRWAPCRAGGVGDGSDPSRIGRKHYTDNVTWIASPGGIHALRERWEQRGSPAHRAYAE